MTNEKKNGNDPAAKERTLEEIISAAAEQEIARIPPAFMTPEKLKAMVAERDAAEKAARKKRRCKVVGGIAAALVLVLVGSLIAINAFAVDVGANKSPKEEIKTEDGVIVEDGGYGASDNTDGVWSTTVWEDVAVAKTIYAQLMIPEYIPKDYEFDKLTIENIEAGNMTSRYQFFSEAGNFLEITIFFFGAGEMSIDIDNITETLECKVGKVYIQNGKNKGATIPIDDGFIRIRGSVSNEELIKVVNNLLS